MSLESALKEHGEKLDTLIGLIQQDIELRKTALGKIAEATAKASAKGSTASDKPKETEKAKDEDKPKEEPADDKLAQAKKLVAKYVGGAGDNADERKARNKKVVALLSNPKVKNADAPEQVKDLKDVNPKAFSAVIKKLEEFIEAGDLTKPADEDEVSLDD